MRVLSNVARVMKISFTGFLMNRYTSLVTYIFNIQKGIRMYCRFICCRIVSCSSHIVSVVNISNRLNKTKPKTEYTSVHRFCENKPDYFWSRFT